MTAEDHDVKGYTDVCYVPGVLGEYAAIACVADEALITIPVDAYVHPRDFNHGEG